MQLVADCLIIMLGWELQNLSENENVNTLLINLKANIFPLMYAKAFVFSFLAILCVFDNYHLFKTL